jgi:peptidoglycan/xylan/chitin deacetylase (PgdA/CDA1 family)
LRRLRISAQSSRVMERVLAGVPSGGGVVLRYHSVNGDAGWSGDYLQASLCVAPDVFDRQMELVCRRSRIVGIGEIADAIRERRPVAPRSVAITFDDGYEDNYRYAFPILRKHGATAAFYVTTGAVGDQEILWTTRLRHSIMRTSEPALSIPLLGNRSFDLSREGGREDAVRSLTASVKSRSAPDAAALLEEIYSACGGGPATLERRVMMNWDEIREMHRAGMTIGAHSVNHYNLPSLEAADLAREVSDSKERIESELGAPVVHFAYPNGRTALHFDRRVAAVVAGAEFRSAVTSIEGAVTVRCSEFSIPRFGVRKRHWDVRRFANDVQIARFARPAQAFESGEVLADDDGGS